MLSVGPKRKGSSSSSRRRCLEKQAQIRSEFLQPPQDHNNPSAPYIISPLRGIFHRRPL
ncbi:hypothetical protein QR685DRAFT_9369 [Neurospora intermedia]|uniref:Uncharacterized protein n=1 Tax=Neurospora intermedia TaxID=5142 RepID=A0ABR3DP44_NEUIN